MFGWFRRIRRINIFGFELEFNHPPVHPPDTVDPDNAPPGHLRNMAAPSGARMIARGVVIKTYGQDLGVRVDNEAEIREFWRVNGSNTKLDWFGAGSPVVSIPAKYAAGCKIGDGVAITLVEADRGGGKRGAQPVAFAVVARG